MKTKKYKPQVGDTLYWKDDQGEIHTETCYEVFEYEDGDKEYYTSPAGNCRFFLVDEDLLNPNSREVQNHLKKVELGAWAEFWSKTERADEIVAWFDKHRDSKDLKKDFGQFIIKKLGI